MILNILPTSEARRAQLQKVINSHEPQQSPMMQHSTIQSRATEASYKVAYCIGRVMAPYIHSDLMKNCTSDIVTTLFPNEYRIVN